MQGGVVCISAYRFVDDSVSYTHLDVYKRQVVPEAVTELLLIGDTEKQVKMNLKQIQYTSLQKIALNNLDINDRINAATTNAKNQLGVALAPVIEDVANKLSAFAESVDWTAVAGKVRDFGEKIREFGQFIIDNGSLILSLSLIHIYTKIV